MPALKKHKCNSDCRTDFLRGKFYDRKSSNEKGPKLQLVMQQVIVFCFFRTFFGGGGGKKEVPQILRG